MKRIGIIGAMSAEVQQLKGALRSVKVERASGIAFHSGYLHDRPVTVAQSGVGKVFAAVCAQTMILKFGVTHLINTGIAGGLSPALKAGDIVVSEALCQHDMDTSAVGDPPGMISGLNQIFFPADPTMRQVAQQAAQSLALPYKTGVIATGDQFVHSAQKRAQIVNLFGAIAAEMEGGAIAQTCAINDVPFVVLRVISDDAGDGAHAVYENFFDMAVARSCALTKEMIRHWQ